MYIYFLKAHEKLSKMLYLDFVSSDSFSYKPAVSTRKKNWKKKLKKKFLEEKKILKKKNLFWKKKRFFVKKFLKNFFWKKIFEIFFLKHKFFCEKKFMEKKFFEKNFVKKIRSGISNCRLSWRKQSRNCKGKHSVAVINQYLGSHGRE